MAVCIIITSQLMGFYRQQVKIQHEGSADGDSFWREEVLVMMRKRERGKEGREEQEQR